MYSKKQMYNRLRIGFTTGSIHRIGSGRTEAVPLAHALTKLGSVANGLETARFKRGRVVVEDLEVHLEPVVPYLASRPLELLRTLLQRFYNQGPAIYLNGLEPYDLAAGDALLILGKRLKLDVIYAFHNINVARILKAWPHPSRVLVINLIGFGIDPTRGGFVDTFPLQQLIFKRPYWDLQITATKFEFDQYCEIYDQLGIDPRKLMNLPHSYDEELFRPPTKSPVGQVRDFAQDQKIILYPVNVYPRKNIELAIDVLSNLNREINCKLVVTGKIWDRDYHARLIKYAGKKGVHDKIQFLGGVPVEEMVRLYQQADITVYTSHQETFGHGIVESLGCGTPVVGPDWISPCREILSESIGGRAVSKEPETFVTAIHAAINLDLSPAEIAANAQNRYGNMACAVRLLERLQEIKIQKDKIEKKLDSIHWKGLYRDAGELL